MCVCVCVLVCVLFDCECVCVCVGGGGGLSFPMQRKYCVRAGARESARVVLSYGHTGCARIWRGKVREAVPAGGLGHVTVLLRVRFVRGAQNSFVVAMSCFLHPLKEK